VALSRASLRRAHAEEPILIPDGERHKNLQTVGRIYDALDPRARRSRERRSSRSAAACSATPRIRRGDILRGSPSSRCADHRSVAQVDSAVGGKVGGVYHAHGKNLIGAFHPPALVGSIPALAVDAAAP
jgi:3-dehydroquinate synthase